MSFANLYRLLLALVRNREMYKSYRQRNMSFRVELSVRDPNHFVFDVVKTRIPKPAEVSPPGATSGKAASPSKPPKAKKKYEYFTSARFGGGEGEPPPLACKIHPALLESCFEVSANELRALSRKDRPRCTSITDDGGQTVRATMFGSTVWRASLHLDADAVFGKSDATGGVGGVNDDEGKLTDLRNPILLLTKDDGPRS